MLTKSIISTLTLLGVTSAAAITPLPYIPEPISTNPKGVFVVTDFSVKPSAPAYETIYSFKVTDPLKNVTTHCSYDISPSEGVTAVANGFCDNKFVYWELTTSLPALILTVNHGYEITVGEQLEQFHDEGKVSIPQSAVVGRLNEQYLNVVEDFVVPYNETETSFIIAPTL